MLSIRDLEAQAKALAPVLQSIVAKAVEQLRADIMAEVIDQYKALMPAAPEVDYDLIAARFPKPVDGKSVEPSEIQAMIDEAVSKLPKPEDGKSVSIDDVKPIIAELVSAIPAPKDGKDGADGQSVSMDAIKSLIDEAISSIALPEPRHGQDGRDAIDIEIMPSIDEQKSYQRGTYATHNGGLWRSYERTHGMKGWECIVDGVASLEINQEGERAFKAIATMASGKVQEKSIHIPAMIDRGVYREESAYEKGDGVTYGGSWWVAQKDAPEGKPGLSADWRLTVKRGRDGKDGANGRDLTKGVNMQ